MAQNPSREAVIEPEATTEVISCCDSLGDDPPINLLKVFAVGSHAPSHVIVPTETRNAWKNAAITWEGAPRARTLEQVGPPPIPFKDGPELDTRGPVLDTRGPATVRRFDGLSTVSASRTGQLFFPPDSQVGVSPTKVVLAANVGMRMTDRNGENAVSRNLNTFFGETGSTIFDPRVYYDRLSERFFISAVRVNDPVSRLYVAVSRSSNPESLTAPTDWCNYEIDTQRQNSWADFPQMGVNEKWLAISTNHFRFSGGFNKTFIWAFDKAALVDNAAGACPDATMWQYAVNIDAGGQPAVSVAPAQHYTEATIGNTPLFFVSAQVSVFTSDRYTLWRLIDRGANAKPGLQRRRLTSAQPYGYAPDAPQRSGVLLDSGDPRMHQVAYRDGRLWAVHTTGCSFAGVSNNACIRAIEITPAGANRGEITFEETYGGGANWYYFYPSVAITGNGDVVVPFQRSRDTQFLGTAVNGKPANAASFDAPRPLRNGACPIFNDNNNGLSRAGDYTGAQADPVNDRSAWAVGEFAGSFGSLGCDWRTMVGLYRY